MCYTTLAPLGPDPDTGEGGWEERMEGTEREDERKGYAEGEEEKDGQGTEGTNEADEL